MLSFKPALNIQNKYLPKPGKHIPDAVEGYICISLSKMKIELFLKDILISFIICLIIAQLCGILNSLGIIFSIEEFNNSFCEYPSFLDKVSSKK